MEANNKSPESLENSFSHPDEEKVKKDKTHKESNADWDDQPGDLVSFI